MAGEALSDRYPSPAVQRLHQLGWQPGRWMHADWWERLDLAQWRQDYLCHPSCRMAIDREIVARRRFPSGPLPGELDAEQCALMALEPRFGQLSVALGLVSFDCPDYLLLGSFRRVLARDLGPGACDQLLALYICNGGAPATLEAGSLLSAAAAAGSRWWQRDQGECPVRSALCIILPAGTAQGPELFPGTAADWILKMERFL